MAIIDKKLIHFKKWNTFISSEGVNGNYTTPSTSATSTSPALYGQIKETSIVFIQDVQKIWTHGKLYDCSTPDLSAYLTAEDLTTLNNFMNNSSVSKDGETLTVKINNSTQSLTNTWRSISDKTNGTSSTISASEKAVKAAYDLAASKTSNTGTVTSVTPGTGLTGASSDAAITTSGTINLKTAGTSEIGGIKVGTANSSAITKATEGTKYYPVNVDSTGLGYVALPSFTTNSGDITGVTAGNGLTGGATSGTATLNVGAGTGISVDADSVNIKSATASELGGISIGYEANGRNYPVVLDTNNKAYVNVPWSDTNTTTFTITANSSDDDVVVLSGTNGTNATTYNASHAKTFGNTTAPYTAKYTSGNSTTSISGYGSSATIKIPQITVDEYGHVRAGADESVTITMPSAQDLTSFVKYNDYLMPNNSFYGKYTRFGISYLNNALYAADKRFNVNLTGFNVNNPGAFFDGSYESSCSINAGGTGKVTISNNGNSIIDGYPYGFIYATFYYDAVPETVSMRVYCNYEPHGIGWHDLPLREVSGDMQGVFCFENGLYNVSDIEINIKAKSNFRCDLVQIDWCLNRAQLLNYPAVTKFAIPQTMYGDYTFEGAVKLGNNTNIKTVHGKSLIGTGDVTITASDLGLSAALKYCGVTTSTLSDGATTNPIVIGGSNHTATAGCVVFYGDKEYVFNGSSWEELGYARTLTLNTITSGTNSSSVEVSAKGHTHNVPKTSTDGVSVASSSHTHTVTADGSVSSTFTGSEVTSGTPSSNTTSVAKGTHTHSVDAATNDTTNVVSIPNANHTHTISIGNATATITIGDKTSGTPSSNTTSVSQGGHSHTASATADNTTNRVSVSVSGHGHTVSGGSHKHSVTATGSVASSFTGSEVTSGVPDTTNVSSVALGSHKHTVSAATDNTTNRVSVPNAGHTHSVSIGDVSATISIGSKTSGAVSTSTSGHTTTVAAQSHTHSVTGTIADGGASHKHSYTPSGSVNTSVTLSGTRDASTGCLTITASASSSFSGTAANTGNTTATHSHTFSNGSASATSTTGTTVPSTSHTHSTNIGSPSVTVSVGSKTTGAADSTNTVSVATGAHTHGMGTAVANNTSNVVNVPNTSHTHSVTAAGSVSSTFTGTSASTDSKTPSITIGAADSSVSVATAAHTHSVPASSSTVSVPNTSHTHTTSIGSPSVSVAIGNKTTGAADTTNTTNVTTAAHTHTASATASGNRVSVPSTSHTHAVTAAGSVSSTFTGLSATTNSITGTTTVASQSHTHTASASSSGTTVANHTHTHSVTPTGSIS